VIGSKVKCWHYLLRLKLLEIILLARNMSNVHLTLGSKGDRELKRLDCSINYEKKGGQSLRARG
jgi:hypothetical protein